MRFLFIAPRFHTNQIEIIKALKKNKYKVHFNSIYKGKIEDYKDLKPFFFKTKYFFYIIRKFI